VHLVVGVMELKEIQVTMRHKEYQINQRQPILEPQEIRALTSKFGAKGTTRSTRHRSNFGATGDANRDTSKFGAKGTT